MREKDIQRICTALSAITLKPIYFNDIKLELLDIKRAKHGPARVYSKHHHPWFEFNYFTEGSFETKMCGKSFVCKSGEAFVIPPGVSHSQVGGKDGDDGICLRWQISPVTNDTFQDTYKFIESINQPHPESFPVNIKTLLDLGSNTRKNCSVFLHFVLSVYDRWQTEGEAYKPKDLISNQVMLYIEEYIKSPIKVMDIAHALNMSYRSLARVFKQETGVSVVEKINELRINKARRLLLDTKLTVSEIATETGFENLYYFSNTFKKYMMLSPTEFREKYQLNTKNRI